MGRKLANWPQRIGAYLIDVLIAVVPWFVAASLNPGGASNSPVVGLTAGVLWLAGFGVWIVNRWFVAGRTGHSWGKQALHLRLLRKDNGQPVGILRAVARDVVHLLDGFPCFPIGAFWPIWDPRRQTFADKVIDTVVVSD